MHSNRFVSDHFVFDISFWLNFVSMNGLSRQQLMRWGHWEAMRDKLWTVLLGITKLKKKRSAAQINGVQQADVAFALVLCKMTWTENLLANNSKCIQTKQKCDWSPYSRCALGMYQSLNSLVVSCTWRIYLDFNFSFWSLDLGFCPPCVMGPRVVPTHHRERRVYRAGCSCREGGNSTWLRKVCW